VAWLAEALSRNRDSSIQTTIAVMDHPSVTSSKTHHDQGHKVWNRQWGKRAERRTLPSTLMAAGVDIVLSTRRADRAVGSRVDGGPRTFGAACDVTRVQ
jgi:hypothetical protein